MYWHPIWGDGWGYGFGWAFMSMLHVFWWVLLVGGAIVLFRTIVGGRRRRNDSALDILRERYARGEIDAAEYEERRRQLKAL